MAVWRLTAVKVEVGDSFPRPAVLKLQLFEPLHLIGLRPAELLPPAIERHLAHANLANGISPAAASR